jgi:two-component system, NarL family, sensor histidine kinase LiaS
MLRFFRSLRGQLILTYTTVTVLALLALEVLALAAVAGLGALTVSLDADPNGYLTDIGSTLAPQARPYLQPGAEDLPGLQAWLEQVAASGHASLPPQYVGDSPAAPLVPGQPLYVLSPERVVLAQAPVHINSLVGRPYTPPDEASRTALESALGGSVFGRDIAAMDSAGNYRVAVPVREALDSRRVAGIILVTVAPPPPVFWSMLWPALTRLAPAALALIGGTAALLLVAVAPLGALFGLVMSRGLTRRLAALSAAADAWSEGNFAPLPPEKGADEISLLSRRLRHMAERIQTLMQSQQALAALQERNRLARELHDTVKQQSFATLMQVRAARNRLGEDPAGAAQHLGEAEQLLKTSQQELGRLIAELRPAALDEQGLADALRAYVDTWSEHARIPASLHVQNERSLPLETEQALYRVAQAALANAARHSRASAVTVRLTYAADCVRLAVADNGVGFDPSAPATGFGLESMRQRLAALNGRLVVESSPAGTSVTGEIGG